MADVLTKKQRSFNMSMVKSRNTTPELFLRNVLVAQGFRGSKFYSKLSGKPDIVFLKRKVAIFIDGCFWHKCPRCFVEPATNRRFWKKKIDSNVIRDKIVNATLKKSGWKVLRVWEHELKNKKIIKRKILDKIKDGRRKD